MRFIFTFHFGVVSILQDSVPDILQSVAEFEPPQSPETTYSQTFPTEEDFAKEPAAVPSQLHLTVLGMENADEASSSKPQHVVLNHLFIEKGWASQSVVALGLTHRFHSKYVTVVLYKPLNRQLLSIFLTERCKGSRATTPSIVCGGMLFYRTAFWRKFASNKITLILINISSICEEMSVSQNCLAKKVILPFL